MNYHNRHAVYLGRALCFSGLRTLTDDPITLEHLFYDNGLSVGQSIKGDSSSNAARHQDGRLSHWKSRFESGLSPSTLKSKKPCSRSASGHIRNTLRGGNVLRFRLLSLLPSQMKSILILSPAGRAGTHGNVRSAGFSKKGAN